VADPLTWAFDRAVRLRAGRARKTTGIEPVAGIEPAFGIEPVAGIEPAAVGGPSNGIEPVFSEATPAGLDAFAVRVIDAGRRALEQPRCPRSWIRRAEGLFREGPHGLRALLALAFDSASGTVPAAARGPRGSRFVRFGRPGRAVDLAIARDVEGGVRVRGVVDSASRARTVELRPARGARLRVRVGAAGAFEADLPADAGAFSVAVAGARSRTLFATGRVRLHRNRRVAS
jgi:hypothetical protein